MRTSSRAPVCFRDTTHNVDANGLADGKVQKVSYVKEASTRNRTQESIPYVPVAGEARERFVTTDTIY
jgi:hypothetical protein